MSHEPDFDKPKPGISRRGLLGLAGAGVAGLGAGVVADRAISAAFHPAETAPLASLSYSQKGMSVIAQVKRSENMFFRSDRQLRGIAGYLNHLPAFANQHTYALAALHWFSVT